MAVLVGNGLEMLEVESKRLGEITGKYQDFICWNW